MNTFYSKHYIIIDDQGRIIDGWSNRPHPSRNTTNACASVEAGAEAYPYHMDGQLCALYPAADITTMGRAATAHKLYHTTRYNHLAAWVRRCETAEEVQGIAYGADLPEDLAENMAAILTAAGGADDAV